jgi:hypothetical protein
MSRTARVGSTREDSTAEIVEALAPERYSRAEFDRDLIKRSASASVLEPKELTNV